MKCWGFPHVSTLFVAAKNRQLTTPNNPQQPPPPRIHHGITASHPAWPRRRKPTTSSSNSKPTWRSWCFFRSCEAATIQKVPVVYFLSVNNLLFWKSIVRTSTLFFWGGLSGVGIAINQLLGLERGALCVHRWIALFCGVALGIF